MSKPKFQNPAIDALFRAILLLENNEECYAFFEDLMTVNELNSLAQRLEVARLLKEGKTYSVIEKDTGASTATISRVKRFLNYGAGGYGLILERMADKQEE